MNRKLAIGALVIAGAGLIVAGGQKWLDARSAAGTVRQFMTAVRDGDRETVYSLLPPAQKKIAQAADEDGRPNRWLPNPGVSYRLHSLDISGIEGKARLWIEKNGFVIKPTMHLRRSDTGQWKILRIEDLEVDRLWQDLMQTRARITGENLANELTDALQGRPGVAVERAPYE